MATEQLTPIEQTASLVTDIEAFIGRYVSIGDDELRVVATWVLHTWMFSEDGPSPNATPYLYIHSAQSGSGKTLLGIELLETLVRNPLQTLNLTGPSLFRVIEELQPTLLIDEVDTMVKNAALCGVLNAGYRRGGRVPRVKPGGEVQMFAVFGPKALVGIDNALLPGTVRERCIPIHMHRATDAERLTIEPFYPFEVEVEAAEFADRLDGWSAGHATIVQDYRPAVIAGLSPRQWEICMPLLAVAYAADCEDSVRSALTNLFGTVVEHRTVEQELLGMIRGLCDASPSGQVLTADILAALKADPAFAGYNGQRLGKVLARFGAAPTTVRAGNRIAKGYKRAMFIEAWERYL